jgi:putative DNA primase/helicase
MQEPLESDSEDIFSYRLSEAFRKYSKGDSTMNIQETSDCLSPIDEFRDAMLNSIGTAPDSIVGDGILHRFKIDGKLNGAYVLHLDGRPAGYFEDFKQGIKQTWKSSSKLQPLSQTARQERDRQRFIKEFERQSKEADKHNGAAERAFQIWSSAKPAPANHPYLVKKGIKPYGVRVGSDNRLIVPLVDKSQSLTSLQFIGETGEKRFLPGGKKSGCFYPVANDPAGPIDTVLICEGFATASSLHETSDYLTIVALDAGNLKDVALVIRNIYPDAKIIICGDNDLNGIGQAKAGEAALAVGGYVSIPPVAGQDWNDALSDKLPEEFGQLELKKPVGMATRTG